MSGNGASGNLIVQSQATALALSGVDAPPQWLTARMSEMQRTGLEQIGQYIIPPRLKVVQPQSGLELKQAHGEGAVVVMPEGYKLYGLLQDGYGEPFFFVPLFFFPEFCTWNPYALKGSVPAIAERSLDPGSMLAYKARHREKWFEQYPESSDPKLKVRHCEHLNFMVLILGREDAYATTPVMLSFVRGEFQVGSRLCGLLRKRVQAGAAGIFVNVFQGVVGPRQNTQGSWWGIDVDNPAREYVEQGYIQPYIPEEMFEAVQGMFDEFQTAYDDKRLRPEYDDDIVSEAPAEAASAGGHTEY